MKKNEFYIYIIIILTMIYIVDNFFYKKKSKENFDTISDNTNGITTNPSNSILTETETETKSESNYTSSLTIVVIIILLFCGYSCISNLFSSPKQHIQPYILISTDTPKYYLAPSPQQPIYSAQPQPIYSLQPQF